MMRKPRFTILLEKTCPLPKRSIAAFLPSLSFSADLIETELEGLAEIMAERPIDAVILHADRFALAEELARNHPAAVAVVAEGELPDALRSACVAAGIMAASDRDPEFFLPALLSESVRLRALRMKANTLQRRLDDTRLVSRAKLLLMSRLQMTEAEAHRYIEKAAMDGGSTRREVAMGIIRTYEE